MGLYASFLSVCLTKNHISATVQLRVLEFGQNIDVDEPNVDIEGQGHRSKKVKKKKTLFQV